MNKSAQVDDKEMAIAVAEAKKAAMKFGVFLPPNDEVAYLKGLVALCEKGKLRALPPKMGLFFEAVGGDLSCGYSQTQLFVKLKSFKSTYISARDKIKAEGFAGFKDAHEETIYMLSEQVWGKGEEGEMNNGGEETRFSKEKLGEEEKSSEKSETELSGKENSVQNIPNGTCSFVPVFHFDQWMNEAMTSMNAVDMTNMTNMLNMATNEFGASLYRLDPLLSVEEVEISKRKRQALDLYKLKLHDERLALMHEEIEFRLAKLRRK